MQSKQVQNLGGYQTLLRLKINPLRSLPNGLPFKLINNHDIPLNSSPPIGMTTTKVTAPMINKVIIEVKIMSKLSGINWRTFFSTQAPIMAAISTPYNITSRIDTIAEKVVHPEKMPDVASGL